MNRAAGLTMRMPASMAGIPVLGVGTASGVVRVIPKCRYVLDEPEGSGGSTRLNQRRIQEISGRSQSLYERREH